MYPKLTREIMLQRAFLPHESGRKFAITCPNQLRHYELMCLLDSIHVKWCDGEDCINHLKFEQEQTNEIAYCIQNGQMSYGGLAYFKDGRRRYDVYEYDGFEH